MPGPIDYAAPGRFWALLGGFLALLGRCYNFQAGVWNLCDFCHACMNVDTVVTSPELPTCPGPIITPLHVNELTSAVKPSLV